MTGDTVTTETVKTTRAKGDTQDRAIGAMLTTPTRRSLLAGAALPAAALGTDLVVLLPAAADEAVFDIDDQRHPDHGLWQAQRAFDDAERLSRIKSDLHNAAYNEFQQIVGPCPACLRVSEDDYGTMTSWTTRSITGDVRFAFMRSFDDEPNDAGTHRFRFEAWTPDALRRAIRCAVPLHGQGGTTPRRIGRYRKLLPISEQYFGKYFEQQRALCLEDLAKDSRDAGRRLTAVGEDFSRKSATTPAGLAIIAARMNGFNWEGMHPSWRNLLRSAAAVTGFEMREPRFDVGRWISRFEKIGGYWRWDRDREHGELSWPIDHTASDWRRNEIADLSRDADEFHDEIRQWMRDRAWEA